MTSWRNRKTLILSRTDMMGLLEPGEYVDCVETAFRRHGEGRCYLEPKGHIVLDKYPGEWEVMPSYIEEPAGAGVTEAAACKWVSIREHNRAKFDLPTVFSILVYTEPETGFPLAIVDGSYHTMMRTGASAAVSIRWLARKDASVLALVGAGDVGIGSLRTCAAVREWSEVRVWSRTQATLDNFMESEAPRHPGLNLVPSTDLEAVVRGADAVVTTTTGADPVVKDAWIADGTHIAALGSDLAGNQELESAIAGRARIFVDDIRQCVPDGEINVPIKEGIITADDVAGEIGAVICGQARGPPGRRRDHALRFDRDRDPGFGDRPARVSACRRGRRRHREEDDLDLTPTRRRSAGPPSIVFEFMASYKGVMRNWVRFVISPFPPQTATQMRHSA